MPLHEKLTFSFHTTMKNCHFMKYSIYSIVRRQSLSTSTRRLTVSSRGNDGTRQKDGHSRRGNCVVGFAIKSQPGIIDHRARYPHRFPRKMNAMAATATASTSLPARTFSSARPVAWIAARCLPRRAGGGSMLSPSPLRSSAARTLRAEAARASAAGAGGAPAAALPAALLFDCDGVLVDTEKDGHRISFNETFAEVWFPSTPPMPGLRPIPIS